MIYADVTCPKCDGLGQWDEMLPCYDPTALEPEYEAVICPACLGQGTIDEDVDQSGD